MYIRPSTWHFKNLTSVRSFSMINFNIHFPNANAKKYHRFTLPLKLVMDPTSILFLPIKKQIKITPINGIVNGKLGTSTLKKQNHATLQGRGQLESF